MQETKLERERKQHLLTEMHIENKAKKNNTKMIHKYEEKINLCVAHG